MAKIKDPFEVLSFSMKRLLDAYEAAGYELTERDRKSFLHHMVMNKSWVGDPSFQFLVMCSDDEEPKQYFLTHLTVWVKDNVAKAEPDSMPFFAGTKDKCKEVFDSMIQGK